MAMANQNKTIKAFYPTPMSRLTKERKVSLDTPFVVFRSGQTLAPARSCAEINLKCM